MAEQAHLDVICFTPYVDCGSGITISRIEMIDEEFGMLRYAANGKEQDLGLRVFLKKTGRGARVIAVSYLMEEEHERMISEVLPKLSETLSKMVI